MTGGILIAGSGSGSGKTTIATGLMAALTKRYRVQPFKVGPDFIDPSHHTRICKRYSRNLDSFLMTEDDIKRTFIDASKGADYSIVEGVMGLYDGLGSTEISSTAHISKILNLPVILVINVHGISRTAAAILKGFLEFDKINIKGVILNKIGSEKHTRIIKESLKNSNIDIPIIGAIPISKNLEIPSRHLGLYMADEEKIDIKYLSDFIEKHIDIDKIKSIASTFIPPKIELEKIDKMSDIRIGIALDSAFCFYYQDSFNDLRKRGAEIVFFSPISGETPDSIDGIYLGGGYPELYPDILETSKTTKWIKKLAYNEIPIYGECGALLYLGKNLETDINYKMTGILDADSRLTDKLQALGYTEAKVISNSAFIKKGKMIKGHEFHYSITESDRDSRFAYKMLRGKGIINKKDGLIEHNTIASYMHTHPSSVSFSEFLKSCDRT